MRFSRASSCWTETPWTASNRFCKCSWGLFLSHRRWLLAPCMPRATLTTGIQKHNPVGVAFSEACSRYLLTIIHVQNMKPSMKVHLFLLLIVNRVFSSHYLSPFKAEKTLLSYRVTCFRNHQTNHKSISRTRDIIHSWAVTDHLLPPISLQDSQGRKH